MFEKKQKFVGVVCARAGSERLPGKNGLPIGGVPMYDLAATKLAKIIDDVYLVTDIEGIEDIESKPYIVKGRPAELSGFDAPVQDVLDWFIEDEGLASEYEYAVMLFPTNPCIKESHIKRAMKMVNSDSPSIVRSYDKSGSENGLYIIDIDYMQNNAFLYDVYTKAITLPGKEIHTWPEYERVRDELE